MNAAHRQGPIEGMATTALSPDHIPAAAHCPTIQGPSGRLKKEEPRMKAIVAILISDLF